VENSLKPLLKYLIDFNEAELNIIANSFKPKKVRKNTLLLSAGETCKEFYYIHHGGLRTYFLDKKGQEKTRYIMLDCSIGTALTSFIAQKPSFEFIEALEDSELMAISHIDFYRLNKEMDSWKAFYQKILEMAYSFQNKKIENLVTLSAKQRYELLLNEHPEYVQRLSNRILATYLDMTQETLSRLKSS
jgi:CRP-like cAMP-binding protein